MRAPRFLRHIAAQYLDWQAGRKARHCWTARGVHVSPEAVVLATGGVALGARTCVHAGAWIAAAGNEIGVKQRSVPRGAVEIGERCQIHRHARITSCGGHIAIGNDVSVNYGAVIQGGGDVRIGSCTRIAPYVCIFASQHIYTKSQATITDQGIRCSGVDVGRDCWLGAGCVVLDGVTIGDGAVVGAGAVVTSDVAAYTVVAGVPACRIGARS